MFWKTLLASIMTLSAFGSNEACTGILQKSENGDWVFARTLEFGVDFLTFDLLFVPRGIEFTSTLPNPTSNENWKGKYAHVGFNPFGMPVVADGLNEKGLAAGAFYFPGWAEYQTINKDPATKNVSNLDFVSWVLSNFASVKEVREALTGTNVVGVELAAWGVVPPLHYFIADKTGDRLVVEYVKGKLQTYDTPIGTITNAPSYDWHLTNARNYIGLRALNRPSIKIDGDELSQFGQGSGAIGLPGDFTPPSRFIRAAFLNQVTLSGKSALEQVNRAFKILNQFDIPRGAIIEEIDGKKHYEETQWTSAADLSGSRYYFHTFNNRNIRSVDLTTIDLDAKAIKSIPINTPQPIDDLSSNFK